MIKRGDVFYRFRDYCGDVLEEKYYMERETPCGYWLTDDLDYPEEYRYRKWVSKDSTKRFAYPSREQAITSFVARKRRQIKILKSQLEFAEQSLEAGKRKESEITGKEFEEEKKIKNGLFLD